MKNYFNPIIESKKSVYFVQAGDTISSIAKKFNTTENIIIKDNFLTCECNVGNCLFIESFAKIYIVKIEDTLDSISKSCKISIEDIININKINYIFPNQKLAIR